LQKRAANALFARLGLEWIPGEYFQLLATHPGPVQAFREFCSAYGINVDRIRAKSPAEFVRLNQVIGILLELGEFRGRLSDGSRDQIISAMHMANHQQAETLLDTARIMLAVVPEAEGLRGKIQLAAFEQFLKMLKPFSSNPTGLSLEEANEARSLLVDFQKEWGNFQFLISVLGGQIAWMLQYWPAQNPDLMRKQKVLDWVKANEALMDGLVVEKERLEKAVHDASSLDEVIELLESLAQVRGDIDAFIKQIQAQYGGGKWQDPKQASTFDKDWQAWCDACDFFGYARDTEHSAETIKKAYRKMALKHHPDRHTSAPPKEREEHERLFKDAAKHRATLDKGKPKK
jgi:hypothetical protein